MDPESDLNNSNASEKLEAMQSELHCGICHDYFVQAFTLSCSHSFCFNCISAWRVSHTDCPVCRQETVGMAPSRALDNMVAAINGGANNANSASNGDAPNLQRRDAWFNNASQNNVQSPQQNANHAEPETDYSYNGESDEGTFYDSEEEADEEALELEEDDDGDFDEDDYYDEEEEGYEDEGEEEQDDGEEEGEYEVDGESSFSEFSEYDEEDESFDDDDDDDDDGNYDCSYGNDYDIEIEDYNEHVKRSNQNNPNNDEYWRVRGFPERPVNWRELVRRQ